MLRIQNLHSGYGDSLVLKNISLELVKGDVAILMGPNGAGKTTLLKSIFNLARVTEGSIVFKGVDITRAPTHKLLGQGIAFVPQGKVNFDTLTVEDNLRLGAESGSKKTEVLLEKIYAQFPELKKKRTEYAFALSGGQQQMLSLGRALMRKPEMLLLDEPSLGLSPKLVKEVFGKIADISKAFQTTTLIVEHNLRSALTIANRGFVLVGGKVIADDTMDNLIDSEILQKVFVGEYE